MMTPFPLLVSRFFRFDKAISCSLWGGKKQIAKQFAAGGAMLCVAVEGNLPDLGRDVIATQQQMTIDSECHFHSPTSRSTSKFVELIACIW
jgi:hypothetical protein